MTRTGWIAALASAAVALLLGFGLGWVGHQTYLRASPNSASEDVVGDVEDASVPEDTPEPEESEEPTPPAPTAPPEGEPTDGVFAYAVTDVATAATYNDADCGSQYTASGVFLVVAISAENTSAAPAFPPADSWAGVRAYGPDGTEYAAHGQICSFSDGTNPGNTSEYTMVFDLPEGAELAALTLAAEGAPEVAVVPVA